ncbi:YbaK/EbsC family protein [Vibrio sp. S4M6]|uniref:aminoacyl-tRNA deacylase n=1 Tax=Vibrio sinus TaxID=2946865 RepID=UPI00202A67D6|nr:YbaK/EbsC family protein [Vibrio sinus]MCL9781532.1 YbaK/EbsC family protein [Vibrio sinus]
MSDLSTPVTRYLDSHGIVYQRLFQEKATTSIEETAQQRGICPSKMVKSILLVDMDNNYRLACVPGKRSVDPKKVRAHFRSRRVTCVAANSVYKVTGYAVGTVSPLLLPKAVSVVFDIEIMQLDTVTISSGNKQFGLQLDFRTLLSLCSPDIADISRQIS